MGADEEPGLLTSRGGVGSGRGELLLLPGAGRGLAKEEEKREDEADEVEGVGKGLRIMLLGVESISVERLLS